MQIRCLSVHPEHARNIAAGVKPDEFRTWRIDPGPLAIASTATRDRVGRVLCVVDVGEARIVERGGEEVWAHPLTNVRSVRQDAVTGDGAPAAKVSHRGLWRVDVRMPDGSEPSDDWLGWSEYECENPACGLQFEAPSTAVEIDCPYCTEKIT